MKPVRLLIFAFVALTAASRVSATEPFRVGYIRVMDGTPAIAAYEGKLYEKQGLDVHLVEFQSGPDLIKAIVGGQLDTGVLGFTNAASWSSRGADLKVVSGAQRCFRTLVVRDDANINTVADLKGHTLASQKEGSTTDVVLREVVLKSVGLKPGDLSILGVSPQVAVQALVRKRVDAAFLFEPQASIADYIAPVRRIYEIGKVWPFPCTVTIASGKTLASRQDLVWKSLDAQSQAIDLVQHEPDVAARLIASYFIATPMLKTLKHGEVPRETIIADVLKTQIYSATLTPLDLSRMQEIANIMQTQGSLKTRDGSPFDLNTIMDLAWQHARGRRAARTK